MAANHTLLLVHGMGTPDDEMFEKWEKKLKSLYQTYSGGEKFSDVFECKSINYNTIFENKRKQWSKMINGILESGAVLPGEFPSKENLESLTDDSFYTTHLLDVLLYRFGYLIAVQVRDFVCNEILDAIKRTPIGNKVSIIAYSLGTAIINDSINVLYRSINNEKPVFTTDDFRFHAFIQLANVSRVLQTKWPAYAPYLRPGVNESSGGKYSASRMLSASHKWDPLVSLKRFQPDHGWPDIETASKNRFQLVTPSIIQDWNTHDIMHYLNDPFVHIPMFKLLMTQSFISDGQESKAVEEFLEKYSVGDFDRQRQKLAEITHGEADFTWKKFFTVFIGYYNLLK
jgi:hypothetical protein